ncbi:MAG TPA: S9 family peptidase [Candidatus Eisenbacteria bacterium]|nr:S9 family peptidase [Candidatus Eisenbacteria bacterium]
MLRVFLAVLLMVPMQANSQNPSQSTPNISSSPSQAAAVAEARPPVAKKIRTEKTINGKTLVDDYAWLRDRSNPDVKALLEAENVYAEYVMKPTEGRQKKLYDEIVSHIKEDDETVPFRRDGYYYYTRTAKGKQYFEVCRKKGSLDAPEEAILDLNKMAEGEKFMAIGAWAVSDDGNLLAYTTDNVGFRQYRLHLRDLRTMQDLPDTAERVVTLAWAADNRTLFYTVEDEVQKRSYRLYRHAVGSETKQDELVYEDADERFNIEVSRTLSRAYLLLTAASHISSEVRFLQSDRPAGEWKVIAPRVDNVEYYVDHRADTFYIRTNDTAQTFRLVTAPVASPGKANWKELVASRPDVPLDNIDVFQNFYVLTEIVAGLPVFRVVQFSDGSSQNIQFPEPAYFATSGANAEFDVGNFRYNYQSLVTPPSVFDYNVKTRQSTLLKENEVPGGFDRKNYASERVFATASDGTKIPISLFYRRDLKNKVDVPLYLYGYGSYGYSLPVTFSPTRLPLVDRGLIVALAHVRGGGELGKPWHDAGKMMNKKNTFTDFIASAEYLTSHGYGCRAKIAIEGGSAGGLLMGAVTNMRPDLFRVVLAEVPFVDVMNTMLDASLPLTVPEYEEWGNPNTEPAFDYMLSYSPYDNLAKKNYPTMLVRTSFDDSQVMYWEPAKYVAKLRTLKTDSNPLVFYTNMHGGHGGSSGRYDRIHEVAFNWAFLLTQLGVPEPDDVPKR